MLRIGNNWIVKLGLLSSLIKCSCRWHFCRCWCYGGCCCCCCCCCCGGCYCCFLATKWNPVLHATEKNFQRRREKKLSKANIILASKKALSFSFSFLLFLRTSALCLCLSVCPSLSFFSFKHELFWYRLYKSEVLHLCSTILLFPNPFHSFGIFWLGSKGKKITFLKKRSNALAFVDDLHDYVELGVQLYWTVHYFPSLEHISNCSLRQSRDLRWQH